jgi:hypothetical protein
MVIEKLVNKTLLNLSSDIVRLGYPSTWNVIRANRKKKMTNRKLKTWKHKWGVRIIHRKGCLGCGIS